MRGPRRVRHRSGCVQQVLNHVRRLCLGRGWHVVRVGRRTMLTVRGEMATFFDEHRRSVRNSDVEVSRTLDLKFWMLLGGEECEINDVRCVRNRSTSTKLWDRIRILMPDALLPMTRSRRQPVSSNLPPFRSFVRSFTFWH